MSAFSVSSNFNRSVPWRDIDSISSFNLHGKQEISIKKRQNNYINIIPTFELLMTLTFPKYIVWKKLQNIRHMFMIIQI